MTSPDIIVASLDEELFFRARTTQIQFAALAARCRSATLAAELRALPYYRSLTAGSALNEAAVSRWLRNGWNTEFLLRQNLDTLDGDGLRMSLQWAFPQAYYSAYTITCAYFAAAGFTESSHSAVIRKAGKQIFAGCYPPSLGFGADGVAPRRFTGLGECDLATPFDFDPLCHDNVDTHIRRFLNATREEELRQRRRQMRTSFRTVRGTPRQNLRAQDWERISSQQGPTSLLSLLYRKRIKANYKDIDTFVCEELDAARLYRDLIAIVSLLNATHECYVAKAIGTAAVVSLSAPSVQRGYTFITERMTLLAALET